MRRIRRNILKRMHRELALSGLALALLTNCGGGGAATATRALPAVGGNGMLSIALHVPAPAHQVHVRSPKYVSPDTQYVGINYAVGANQTFTQAQLDTPQASFGIASPGVCTTQSNGSMFCSLAVSLTPGTYSVAITTWDGAPSGGTTFATNQELSQTVLPSEVVVAGAAATPAIGDVSVALDAIPASIAMTALPGQTHVIQVGTTSEIVGMSPVAFLVEPIDAAGDIIIGLPTLAVSLAPDSAGDTQVLADPANPNLFGVQVVAWNSAPLSLTATATPQVGSGLSPMTGTLAVQPVQEFWGAYENAGPIDGLAGFGLFPNTLFAPPFTGTGTTTASTPIDSLLGPATTSNDFSGVAVDSSGNLWVIDRYNSTIVEFPVPGAAGALSVSSTQLALSPAPTSANINNIEIAADANGNIWVTDAYNSYIEEYSAATGALENEAPISNVIPAIAPSSIGVLAIARNGPLAGDIITTGAQAPSFLYTSLIAVSNPFTTPTMTTLFTGTATTEVSNFSMTPNVNSIWMTLYDYSSGAYNLALFPIASATSLGPLQGEIASARSCDGRSSSTTPMGFNQYQLLAASGDGSVWVAPAPASYGTACNYTLSGTSVVYTGGFIRDASDGAVGLSIAP